MSDNEYQAVQFFGGPVDGHADLLKRPTKPFVAIKTMAQNRDTHSLMILFRVLLFNDQTPPFLLAVYEWEAHGKQIGYHYVRSSIATDVNLTPTLVDALVQSPDQSLRRMELKESP